MNETVLTEGDRNSGTWQRIEQHLKKRLEALREQNDKEMPDLRTARLRGHIDCLKAVLSLGADRPTTQSDDDLFKD